MNISYFASKLLALAVYPLSLSLALSFVALLLLWVKQRRIGIWVLSSAFGWLCICSTGVFADFLMSRLESPYPSRAMSAVEGADAIVLLGGATRGPVHLGRLPDLNQHADRLVHATALYKAKKAPVVVVSGGAAPGHRPEASQIKDLLEVMGVPSGAILSEVQSRNTYDNALYTAKLLRAKKIQRVLLVTSAFHMRRAEAVFRAQGVDVVPAPADYKRLIIAGFLPRWIPTVGNLTRSTLALHEMAGYWVYRFQGRL